jgi:serine phosphatase RsbU (regulator of sigma subunit)
VIPYKSGDQLFLFTDGFFDQFGGEKFKKFTKKRIFTILNSKQSFNETCNMIENSFFHWKGDLEQTDDCLFMGFEL